jgi:hypothetical protein
MLLNKNHASTSSDRAALQVYGLAADLPAVQLLMLLVNTALNIN